MKQKLYIDFDGTLFDTDAFYKEFLGICFKYGITKEKIEEIKNEIFSEDNLYDMDKIVDYLINNYGVSSRIISEVETLYSNKFVYDDVIVSLEKLKDLYELIILTYGNINYQVKKINGSNLEKYFTDIIITEKNKSLLNNVDYKNSIFIDNNPKEVKRFVEANSKEVIRIRRASDKYSVKDLEVEAVEYTNFKDITKDLLGKSKSYL